MVKQSNSGYTLTELMIVVAVIGILSAVTITVSGNEWRRERVNTVASELAGWLQTVRRAALKGSACTVTISGGAKTGASAAFATAVDAGGAGGPCASSQAVGITTTRGNDTYTISPTGTTTFLFTPRGSVNASGGNTQLTTPIEISISRGGAGPTRCVRISPGLGLITIGASNGLTTAACDTYGGAF